MKYPNRTFTICVFLIPLISGCASVATQDGPSTRHTGNLSVSRLQPVKHGGGMAFFSASPAALSTQQLAMAKESANIQATIDSLVSGLEKRDTDALTPLYVADTAATYFSPLQTLADGKLQRALPRDLHLANLNACMANFSSVRVIRDPEDIMRVGDGIALWTGTGTNEVTFKSGNSSNSKWRWTLVLERNNEGKWLVTHEHSSFEPVKQ
jgi:ketosteroid isomerase-like protein